jgi:hypothetical protein
MFDHYRFPPLPRGLEAVSQRINARLKCGARIAAVKRSLWVGRSHRACRAERLLFNSWRPEVAIPFTDRLRHPAADGR